METEPELLWMDSRWFFGGLASAGATLITHPADVIRVQMQSELLYLSSRKVARLILKNRGATGFYHGLSAAIQRQFTYAMTRFGFYDYGKKHFRVDSFTKKIMMAAATGFISGYINTPIEKVNVHFRTDAIKPTYLARNYHSTNDGLRRIHLEGGFRGLFAGAIPSGLRGMWLSVGQLAIYDQVKEKMLMNDSRFRNDWETYFIASVIAGGIATIISTPFEIVKSVRMNAEEGVYQNNMEVLKEIIEKHGYRGFYRGLVLSFLRFVPQTVLTFLIYEELSLLFGIPVTDI